MNESIVERMSISKVRKKNNNKKKRKYLKLKKLKSFGGWDLQKKNGCQLCQKRFINLI